MHLILIINLLIGLITFGNVTLLNIDDSYLYNNNSPVEELNNHTLREVFEESNKVPYLINDISLYALTNATLSLLDGVATVTWNGVGSTYIFRTIIDIDLVPSGNNVYIRYNSNRTEVIAYAYHNDGSFQNINNNSILGENSGILTLTEPMARFGLLYPNIVNNDFSTTNWLVIDRTILGISHLTIEQMDNYYNQYQLNLENDLQLAYTINELSMTDLIILLSFGFTWFAVVTFISRKLVF